MRSRCFGVPLAEVEWDFQPPFPIQTGASLGTNGLHCKRFLTQTKQKNSYHTETLIGQKKRTIRCCILGSSKLPFGL